PWPRPTGIGPDGAGGAKDPSQTPTHPGLGPVVPRKASGGSRGFAAEVVQLLHAYFAGESVPLEDVPVDLDYETSFFDRCADALRRVPSGVSVSYSALAGLASARNAASAAGSLCARNRK